MFTMFGSKLHIGSRVRVSSAHSQETGAPQIMGQVIDKGTNPFDVLVRWERKHHLLHHHFPTYWLEQEVGNAN